MAKIFVLNKLKFRFKKNKKYKYEVGIIIEKASEKQSSEYYADGQEEHCNKHLLLVQPRRLTSN